MMEIHCTNCRRPYPSDGVPYRCSACGGIFDFLSNFHYEPEKIEPGLPGIWRYRHTFGLPTEAPVISLGEGRTPLVWKSIMDRDIAFKLEYANPSGSFKDRGSAVLVSFLKTRCVQAAVEDSSGNAGASFAAYAAHVGIQASIYIPEYSSGPKRAQIESYGAEMVSIAGPRSKAAEAVRCAADAGAVYASHAYLPHGLAGYATIAYELAEQMEQPPATIISPVGQGNLLLGIGRGFDALRNCGWIKKSPLLVGVQALACAPLWAVHHYGAAGLSWATEGRTLAEGVRVKYPLRGDAVLHQVETTQGTFVAVDEDHILPGRDQLNRLGLPVEPTSALVWDALEQVLSQLPEPVVVILTGAGFKSDK